MHSWLPPALRYPAYRAYWLGLLASVSGFQMFRASQFWLIHQINENPLYLGYVGAATAVPGIVFNLFGGVFADKVDKRRLVMATQFSLAGLIFLLGTLNFLGLVSEYHVLATAFLAGVIDAFDVPASQALFPRLISRSVLTSAVALNSSVWQGIRIVAPAIAGGIIAVFGMTPSLYVAAAGPFIMAAVIYRLYVPHVAQGASRSPVQDILEGLKFIRNNSTFGFLIGMTFYTSFFGMTYVVMMPEIAKESLGRGAGAYGTLLSVGGIGSLITTTWLGSRADIKNKGWLIVGGAVLLGITVVAFGMTTEFVRSYFLAMALLFSLGMFTSLYMIPVQSALQIMVPDRMRGRVMGFYGMTYSIMPLGGLQAGALAQAIQVPFAIVVGGLAVTGFALGPALFNSKVRNLNGQSTPVETPSADATTR